MKIKECFAYLCVKDAARAVDFYRDAFGAREKFRLVEPSGKIGHVELDLGCATLMLSDEFPEYGTRAPDSTGPRTFQMHLHVDNCDEFIARAVALGAAIEMPATDQFYGERSGTIRDPFGHRWNIGHPIETLTPEEMQRRYTAMLKGT